MLNNDSKPCLVQTGQGFSVLYNQRFLYSKYNPSKSILQTINNLNLQTGTLILCNSPILPYGLCELAQKLPQNCFMLLCEFDSKLYDFSTEQLSGINQNFARLTLNELNNLPFLLQEPDYTLECGIKLPPAGTFRRVIRVDFSASVQFLQSQYNALYDAVVSSIKTFWVNRITLTKFGRRYSKNFFINLKNLPNTTPIQNYFNKVEKPILVLGAGESSNKTIELLKKDLASSAFFILCVDTILPALLKNGITPDGVFIEEAQPVISKAFIGAKGKNIHLFAGLSSLPLLSKVFPLQNISYFTTLYTNSVFISKLQAKKLLPPSNQPLGSVGLTTIYYALKFRKNSDVPILISGLDFSYSTGITHAKGTMAHIQRLFATTKLQPVHNYAAAYSIGTSVFTDKSGNNMITTTALQSYAALFTNLFSHEHNLFDITTSGIPLKLPQRSLTDFIHSSKETKIALSIVPQKQELQNQINNFFEEEHLSLIELKELLIGNNNLQPEEQIKNIENNARLKEYLYLHFPDGHLFSTDISFLKRIRAEIDYFLKFI